MVCALVVSVDFFIASYIYVCHFDVKEEGLKRTILNSTSITFAWAQPKILYFKVLCCIFIYLRNFSCQNMNQILKIKAAI